MSKELSVGFKVKDFRGSSVGNVHSGVQREGRIGSGVALTRRERYGYPDVKRPSILFQADKPDYYGSIVQFEPDKVLFESRDPHGEKVTLRVEKGIKIQGTDFDPDSMVTTIGRVHKQIQTQPVEPVIIDSGSTRATLLFTVEPATEVKHHDFEVGHGLVGLLPHTSFISDPVAVTVLDPKQPDTRKSYFHFLEEQAQAEGMLVGNSFGITVEAFNNFANVVPTNDTIRYLEQSYPDKASYVTDLFSVFARESIFNAHAFAMSASEAGMSYDAYKQLAQQAVIPVENNGIKYSLHYRVLRPNEYLALSK